MKCKINKIYMALVASLVLASCKKDDSVYFDADTMIYVTSAPDSLIYSFSTRPNILLTDTIMVDCTIMGKSSPVDRPVTVVVRDTSSAKVNYHYKILPVSVRANAFSAQIPVVVYRRPGLKDSTLYVVLDIKDNESIKAGYRNRLRYKIALNDKLGMPSLWEWIWKGYFGEYSEVKLRFLISATGYQDWEQWPFPQQEAYLNGQARLALLKYNQSNPPLRDEFGNLVFFP